MTSEQTDYTAEGIVPESTSSAPRRRQFLAALGVGSSLAVAGCLSSDEGDDSGNGDSSGDDASGDDGDDGSGDGSDDTDDEDAEIDPRFGYTAVAGEDSVSVEPDHTVELHIRPREGVPIPEFYFEPVGLFVEPGDTVEFSMVTPHHNVNAFHPQFGYEQRVPDGVPAFSSPILAGGDAWYYTFEQEGVYDYTCAPHELFGMAGRIVVGEASGPGANPVGEAPGGEDARPPDGTSGLVLGDPALEPETIVEEGSVSWSDLDPESKRLVVSFEEEGGH